MVSEELTKQIVALHFEGWGKRVISERTGLNISTVQYYIDKLKTVKRKDRPSSIVDGVDPLVRKGHEILTNLGMSLSEASRRSGNSDGAIRSWFKGKTSPTLDNYEAFLNVLGYELVIRKRDNA